MFFKQVTFMRSTLIALSAITFGMHSAAAMPSTETKAYAASTSSVPSSAQSSGSTSSATAASATVVPPPPVLTRSNAITTVAAQQTPPASVASSATSGSGLDSLTPEKLRTWLELSTTLMADHSELSGNQIHTLSSIVLRPLRIIKLNAKSLSEAFNRAKKYNWTLAKLIILTANLYHVEAITTVTTNQYRIETNTTVIEQSSTQDSHIELKCSYLFPIEGLTQQDHIAIFNPDFIRAALYEAIGQEQWFTISQLLKHNSILMLMPPDTANDLLIMAALVYNNQAWLVHRIVNSPILGPKITAETYDIIRQKGRPEDIATIRQSPYFAITMKKQQSAPRVTSTITSRQNEPTEKEYQNALYEGFSEYEGFEEYSACIKQHPTITIPKGVAC